MNKQYNIYIKRVGVILLPLVIFFSSLSAQTWYVNDGSLAGDVFTSSVGNNSNPGTAAAPFATIDFAITTAADGDIIYVDAGNYSGEIIISKSLTLRGAKFGIPAGPLAVPINRMVNESILTGSFYFGQSRDNITLDGFTVDVVAPNLQGIEARGLNSRVINNIVTGVPNFFQIQIGIATRANGPLRLQSYEILNNHVSGMRYGIYFDGNLENPSDIFYNYVSGAITAAFVVGGSSGHHYKGNVAENNVRGMLVTLSNYLIEQNTFRGNLSSGIRMAANPELNGNIIINNFFENNNIGIELALDDPGAANNQAHFNSFTGNTTDIASDHSAEFDAACNWYGTTDQLTIASGINGNVRYVPFLTDGTDTEPATPGFQPNITCIVVPVVLTEFTGQWSGKDALLKWTTEMESSNRHFEIERSLDGRQFNRISLVQGTGNSNSPVNYNYSDAGATRYGRILYYRLKQVDLDGRFSYSNIVVLKYEGNGTIVVYPNPASTELNISINESLASYSRYQLMNLNGQVVKSGYINSDHFFVNVATFPQGPYIIRITDDKGNIKSRRFNIIK